MKIKYSREADVLLIELREVGGDVHKIVKIRVEGHAIGAHG